MNTLRIIEKEGYRFEDLAKENQNIMSWLKGLRQDIECFEWEDEDVMEMPDSIIGKMKQEIADNVMEQFKQWMDIQLADYQISMIESQLEDE